MSLDELKMQLLACGNNQDWIEGRSQPAEGLTMIGVKRMDNIRACIENAVFDGVPGDVLEAGVWRGGAVIWMRAVLKELNEARRVWVCDSFQGLPPPDTEHFPQDAEYDFSTQTSFRISADQIRMNFLKYGLFDYQVRFLEGWFRDTMPTAPVCKLAVLRLDCDLYESNMQVLEALYPKVSDGGYVIVDDYGALPPCRQAIDDYRAKHDIADKIETIDWTGIYWKKNALSSDRNL